MQSITSSMKSPLKCVEKWKRAAAADSWKCIAFQLFSICVQFFFFCFYFSRRGIFSRNGNVFILFVGQMFKIGWKCEIEHFLLSAQINISNTIFVELEPEPVSICPRYEYTLKWFSFGFIYIWIRILDSFSIHFLSLVNAQIRKIDVISMCPVCACVPFIV